LARNGCSVVLGHTQRLIMSREGLGQFVGGTFHKLRLRDRDEVTAALGTTDGFKASDIAFLAGLSFHVFLFSVSDLVATGKNQSRSHVIVVAVNLAQICERVAKLLQSASKFFGDRLQYLILCDLAERRSLRDVLCIPTNCLHDSLGIACWLFPGF
jgi:hypothetical protein